MLHSEAVSESNFVLKPDRTVSRAWKLLGARAFISLLAGTYLMATLAYLFVAIVNPYAVRPWGANVKVSSRPYSNDILPRLIYVAAKDGSDLVLIGGSTAMGYTTPMLHEAFPNAKKPVNLSFTGPSARDYEVVLSILEKSKSLKRLIINADWSLLRDVPGFGRVWNQPPYNVSWSHPVPEFGVDAIRASVQVLRTGTLDLPDWISRYPDRPDFIWESTRITDSRDRVTKLVDAVDASRSWITRGQPVGCGAMPLQGILPYLKRLSSKGVQIEILFPPYSLAMYADWSLNSPPTVMGVHFDRGAAFAGLASLRRCAVELTAGMSNVRVHALDADTSITGNLSGYVDTMHMYGLPQYRDVMLHVARRDAVLTPENLSRFEADLAKKVEEFRPQS